MGRPKDFIYGVAVRRIIFENQNILLKDLNLEISLVEKIL